MYIAALVVVFILLNLIFNYLIQRFYTKVGGTKRRTASMVVSAVLTLVAVGITRPSNTITVSPIKNPVFSHTAADYFGLAGKLHELTYNDGTVHDFVVVPSSPFGYEELIDAKNPQDGQFHRTVEKTYLASNSTNVVVAQSDIVWMNNSIDSTSYVILPQNIREHAQWSYSDAGIQFRNAILGLANVTTPAGAFPGCLVVVSQSLASTYTTQSTALLYYAPGVGLVYAATVKNGKATPFQYVTKVQPSVPLNQFPK